MVVGLGALGIVSRLTLDIEPSFEIAQSVFEGLDWEQVLASFDDVTSSAYSVSLFTDWSGTTVGQAWLKNRTDQAVLPAGFAGILLRHPGHARPGTRCPACPEATARSNSAFPGRGPTGSPTSGWNSPPARARSCRANT